MLSIRFLRFFFCLERFEGSESTVMLFFQGWNVSRNILFTEGE